MRHFGAGERGGIFLKNLISGFCVAFSLYSIIPMPRTEWDKHTMKYALCFFPLVGVIVGALQYLWYLFARHTGLETVLYGVVSVLIPLVVTGGIHLDGFTDTSDALCSYGDQKKRLEILKDPHVGAFGVMYLVALLLLQLGLFCQLYQAPACIAVLCVGYALARTVGGSAIVWLRCAKDSGLAYMFSESSDRKTVRFVLAAEMILCLMGMMILSPPCGGAILAILAVLWPVYRHFCTRTFGGVTGDLAGFAITGTETIVIFACVVAGLILR